VWTVSPAWLERFNKIPLLEVHFLSECNLQLLLPTQI
jgi:hypothetical protein